MLSMVGTMAGAKTIVNRKSILFMTGMWRSSASPQRMRGARDHLHQRVVKQIQGRLGMIRKSGYRFSEKIMLKQKDRAG
jgi:hypothetical protein